MSYLHLVIFIMFMLGYWCGRDTNKRPMTIAEHGAPIVYGWAFVGVLNWAGFMVSSL